MRPYEETTGSDLLRDLKARIARLERSGAKTVIPESGGFEGRHVDGAMLYVSNGQLVARIGDHDHLLTATPDTWQGWSPSLTATETDPTMADTDTVGRYIVRSDGTVSFSVTFTFGSSFTPGVGFWMLPLPTYANVIGGLQWSVRIHATNPTALGSNGEAIGYGKIETYDTVTRMFLRRNDSTANGLARVDENLTWPSGSKLVVSGEYEKSYAVPAPAPEP